MRREIEDALQELAPSIAAEVRRFVESAAQPLVPGDPRRHHHVAQFYLERFADESKRIAIVRLGDPNSPTITHIKNAAVIKDFYTIVDPDGHDTAVIEKLLALVEGAAKPAIERLAFGVLFPPQPKDRVHVALWVALQFVRDPMTRRRMEAMADAFVKMHVPDLATEEEARAYLRERDDAEPTVDAVAAFLEGVRDLQWEAVPSQNDLVKLTLESAMSIVPFLLDRRWAVVRFPEPGLVTGDRPVVLYQHPEGRRPFLGMGIATADEISIPLDRRSLLVLHNDEVIGERVLPAAPGQTTSDFNEMLAFDAHEELYCHPADVALVQRLELPAPNRSIVTMEGGAWGDRPLPDGINAAPKRARARRYPQARNSPPPAGGATDS